MFRCWIAKKLRMANFSSLVTVDALDGKLAGSIRRNRNPEWVRCPSGPKLLTRSGKQVYPMSRRQTPRQVDSHTFMAALNGGGTVSTYKEAEVVFPKAPQRTPYFTSRTER
jgi:hypothetical protein